MRPYDLPVAYFGSALRLTEHDQSSNAPRVEPQSLPNNRCRLLELPNEILNSIYQLVLVRHDVLWVDPEGKPIDKIWDNGATDQRRLHYLPSEPALTRTCQRIRQETLPIFYGSNTFCDTPADLCCVKFFIYLTPAKRKMLRSVRIAHWGYYASKVLHVDGGPPGTCHTSVRIRLALMRQWLRRCKIYLADEALHIPIKPGDDAPDVWTNTPQGICELHCCRIRAGKDVRTSLSDEINARYMRVADFIVND